MAELLVHTPPLVASVSTVVAPWHTIADEGDIAAGPLFTVTACIAAQLKELVSEMVAVPIPEPVTRPEELPTDAILEALLLHVPDEPSVNNCVLPRHKVTGEEGDMAPGVGLTVMGAVAEQVPML